MDGSVGSVIAVDSVFLSYFARRVYFFSAGTAFFMI